ncbi:hypothetical protein TUM4438_34370 [Shewanella sairae]|uniref:Uncharacterized protein n=1 Tax=Shewanella sairae TaxID=190310 RepID=A0ABQ4PN61_9GAMM|nr:hypothetical protein [Shewanella sairae]MCL1131933.1 hypothetical protein [Shewanella sairae]GIU49849.1 hypothetical protein TUM4438_34370 [Shewanella sairae]
MKKLVSLLLGLSGALCYGIVAGGAHASEAAVIIDNSQPISSQVELLMRKKAGTMVETCVAIPAKYKVSFNYTSPEETLFSVHYHQDGKVLLAYDEDKRSALTSQFTTKLDQNYCFTWVNSKGKTNDGVILLEYEATPI